MGAKTATERYFVYRYIGIGKHITCGCYSAVYKIFSRSQIKLGFKKLVQIGYTDIAGLGDTFGCQFFVKIVLYKALSLSYNIGFFFIAFCKQMQKGNKLCRGGNIIKWGDRVKKRRYGRKNTVDFLG